MSSDWQRPLTQAQQGIWLGQQMDITSPRYNTAEYIELRGNINMPLFEQALREQVDQTFGLHLRFVQTGQGPQQRWEQTRWQLEHIDFSGTAGQSTGQSTMQAAQVWMQHDLTQWVDLQQGPMFKQALLTLGTGHYLWYQRIHHIACDGFAFALLTQAVAEAYSALVDNNSKGVNRINNSADAFDDIIREDQAYCSSTRFTRDRDFWLATLPARVDNTGQSRPDYFHQRTSFSCSTGAIAERSIRTSEWISATEFTALQTLAKDLNASWSAVLMAAVAHLLYRRTGAREPRLGIPVMNRMGSASLRVVAMVMNIVPLNIAMDGIGDFSALVQAVHVQLTRLRPHQGYRYEQLKRDLAISAPASLFGPVVNIMPFDRPLGFAGLQAQAHTVSAGPVEDISFAFVSMGRDTGTHAGGLRMDVDANPNRYTDSDVVQLRNELLSLLRAAIHNPQLPVCSGQEYFSWLEGKTLVAPVHPILHHIYQQRTQRPEAIALQVAGQEINYLSLTTQAATLAQALVRKENIAAGSVIALVLPRSVQAIIAPLACWLLDCTFVFLDPDAPAERNRLILENAQPALVLTAESISAAMQVENDCSPASLDETWHGAAHRHLDACAPAYLIYTSGSTGTPKGVVIGHRALAEFIASNNDAYRIQPHDRVLQFAPLHFDACIEEIFVTLSQGARLVLRNSAMLESMPAFLQQCREWKISVLDLPTAFWHELAFACKHLSLALPPDLRCIIIGGEAVIAERVAIWRACFGTRVALFNTYGPSEATVIASCIDLCAADALQHPISIGTPLSGRAIAVVDAGLQLLPKGEEGELLLLGAPGLVGGLADGYWQLPEKSAQAFIQWQQPWQKHPLRAYRTGDRVRINRANHIEFIGRLDDQLKISGYRIDPLEIEAALTQLPGVYEAAVVAVVSIQGDKTLVAHLVSEQAADINLLRSQLKTRLPAPMLPAAVIYHSRLPKSAAGKINRTALQQITLASTATTRSEPLPTSTQQQLILRLWQEVLGRQQIQLDDDFFALGGQSLQCIQLANRLSSHLQREIPVAWLFQHPSIRSLDSKLCELNPMPCEVDARLPQSDASNTQAEAGNTRPAQRHNQQQMLADCLAFEMQLPPANPLQKCLHKTQNPCVLLTGATGFVGAQLLAQLLNNTRHKVICLVRATDIHNARWRLEQALQQQGLVCRRLHDVHIQLADLEKPQLGLTQDGFLQLAHAADVIIHSAANTSVMRDYQSLRAANALSTAGLLQLAAIQQIPFHLISTVALALADDNTQQLFLPESCVPCHDYLRDGYQQSKWVAEQMAAIAQQKGYAINIYRLARVTGDAESAYVNQKDLVWSILQAGLPMGVLPDLQFEEPWTPVDKLAQFITRHSLDNPGAGVFNLAPPGNLALRQLYRWLAQAGQVFTVIPLTQWCARIKNHGPEQHHAIAEFFRQNLPTNNGAQTGSQVVPPTPHIHHQKFDQAAAALGVQLPAIDQQLFNRYFAYASARDWFASAQQPEGEFSL